MEDGSNRKYDNAIVIANKITVKLSVGADHYLKLRLQ